MKNMKTSFIATAVAALVSVYSFSASAVQKDITVTAQIDSTLEIMQADGSSLPSTMKLDFLPGAGLIHKSISTRVYSNAMTKGVNVKLMALPKLVNVVDPTKSVELAVKLNNANLTETDTLLPATTLFPGGAAAQNGGSIALELDISQAAKVEDDLPAGTYSGTVSLVISQATAA